MNPFLTCDSASECVYLNVTIQYFFFLSGKSKLNAKNEVLKYQCMRLNAQLNRMCLKMCLSSYICFSRPCSLSQSCYCFTIILFCLTFKFYFEANNLVLSYWRVIMLYNSGLYCGFKDTVLTFRKKNHSELSFKMRRKTVFIIMIIILIHAFYTVFYI